MARNGVDVNFVLDSCDESTVASAQDALIATGFDMAWVACQKALSEDPAEHDARLAESCGGHDVLWPVPVVVPPSNAPGVLARLEALAARDTGRVVRLCPPGHRFPLADWVLTPLPELCDRGDVALVIDFHGNSIIPWLDVVDFARAFPCLPMVLLGPALGHDSVLDAALDATANLIFALSGVRSSSDFERLVERYGSHRFVLGSGGSVEMARTVLEQIHTAQIACEARQDILTGTAELLSNGGYRGRYL